MLSIQEPNQDERKNNKSWHQHALFSLAFRGCFLLGTLVSILAVTKWIALLSAWWIPSAPALSPFVWHLHEMLFGFAATIAVGFILTAVQTWTGQKSISGLALAVLLLVWSIARILFWLNMSDFIYLAIFAQLLWWVWVVVVYSKLVLRSRNRRNYVFIIFLVAMAILNMSILISDLTQQTQLSLHLGRVMVLLFVLLMTLLGGRVIPFFTQRGANLSALKQPAWIEKSLLLVTLTAALFFALSYLYSLAILAHMLLVISGVLHLVRLAYWQSFKTLNIPLLWSLHISYLCLAFGTLLMGLSKWIPQLTISSALHLLTIGAMAGMIFSMMSRVSLGHTGRPLNAHFLLPYAFYAIFSAAVARALLPLFEKPLLAWQISAFGWLLTASLFLIIYVPILIKPRQQSAPL